MDERQNFWMQFKAVPRAKFNQTREKKKQILRKEGMFKNEGGYPGGQNAERVFPLKKEMNNRPVWGVGANAELRHSSGQKINKNGVR